MALRQSQRESEQLRHRLDQLLRRLYGPRAERFHPDQPFLFDVTATDAPPLSPAPEAPGAPTAEPKSKRPGHGRQQLPKHLPREQRVYELSAAERACPCCGQSRVVMGKEISEQLDYVPASLTVIEHVRLTYKCQHCPTPSSPSPSVANAVPAVVATTSELAGGTAEIGSTTLDPAVMVGPTGVIVVPISTLVTAPKPLTPLPRCLAAPGLLAYVIVSKFGDHLPLYRLEHIFGRGGVTLRRSTLCDWLADSATVLRPLYEIMVQAVLQSWVIQTDDTPVPVQDPRLSKTRQGRVWVYWGDLIHPYAVYDYTPTHEQIGPQQFLANYCGYLQADAYSGYEGLYGTGRMFEVGCWAHARRKFYEAQATDPARSLYAMGVIRQLYHVEKQADEIIATKDLTREASWWLRLRLRDEQARPILTNFGEWLNQQYDQVLPKSPIATALGYALNRWPAFLRYTTQGYLVIDNNAAERALRAIAVGRKNYLFFGSDGGGATAAVLYSLVQSCKRLSIEPWRYLRDVLERLPTWPAERRIELLPDRWAATQRLLTRETAADADGS